MFKLLIDTSVWLDLAKDHRQQVLLSALEGLIERKDVAIILPQIVIDEFKRNKQRVIEESARSHSGFFKRVKDAVARFGDENTKGAILQQLNDLDHRIGTLGEAANASVARIERLFEASTVFPTSDAVKLRAAERAIANRAPFHRQRNGIGDAILIETYAAAVEADRETDVRFAFVTHNTKDFSDTNVDNRKPHPDIAASFSPDRSTYSISLAETLNEVAPELLEDFRFELEWTEEPRRLSEILDEMDLLTDRVWYNRHWNRRIAIEQGQIELVEKETFPVADHSKRPIQRDIWEGALRAAKRVEEKHGLENLGPWDDFEWGMINGKLSALRWVLGDEWDSLDT